MNYDKFKQLIKFIVSGGTTASISLICRWIFFHFMPYSVSIILAYIIGMILAFIAFKFIVFKSAQSKKTKKEIVFFIIVNIIAVSQTLIISLFLAELFFPYIGFTLYPYDVAHVIGVMIPVISSFILHNKYTFPKM